MEMVVTLVIIGLMTAAIGVGTRTLLTDSESRAAESNIQRVLLAEQRFAVRNGGYSAFVDDLGPVREVVLVNESSQAPEEVSVALGADGTLGLAARRDAEVCVLLRAGRLDGDGSTRTWTRSDAPCTGAEALPSTEAEDLDAATQSRARD